MELDVVDEQSVSSGELEKLLAEARERLEILVQDLRRIDEELEGLATERAQHELLDEACRALDELNALGGAALFWKGAAEGGQHHLVSVRQRVAEFRARIGKIEERRAGVLGEINAQQEHALLLEDDVFEALREEERRQHEWIIERDVDAIRPTTPIVAWARGEEDDTRYRKALRNVLLACFALAVVLPMIPLPVPEPDEPIEVPERVITMMMETRPTPPPRVEPVPPPPPPKVAEQKPVEKPVPQRSVQPQAEPEPAPAVPQGILAFREKLEAVKDVPVLAELGSQARINDANESSVSRAERAMLTTNAPGSSGGIHLAALSRNFGPAGGAVRGAIQGTALTRASSNISTIGPGDRPRSDGAMLSRTDEEIQIVFDRYKASLYRLYNRELRQDPTLQGQMILRLTIEPDGSVSFCVLHATDMNAPELATQVVERVRTFDFGAKEVPAITIVYPIDFLPAT